MEKRGLMRVSRFTEQGKVRAPVAQELVEGNWLRGFRGDIPVLTRTPQCCLFEKKRKKKRTNSQRM